jgi:sugar phosphate isomerase/epimerase
MFRVGTTSYIIPDDILPNVAYLASLVDDVELVLFETDEYGSNLPDAGQVARLRELAAQHGTTYTIHLPLDLRLAEDGSAGHVSLLKARRVIHATAALDPFAYTLHLDARELGESPSAAELARWQENSARALETVASWLPSPGLLAVENLEKWDPEWFAPVLGRVPVSRTMDVGHLWLAGLDPIPFVAGWCDRARIVHLHGVGSRDHESLSHAPRASLDAVVGLLAGCFDGVVTLEVFNQPDFLSSLATLRASMARHGLSWSKNGG